MDLKAFSRLDTNFNNSDFALKLKRLFQRHRTIEQTLNGENLHISFLGSILKDVDDYHYFTKNGEWKDATELASLEYVGSGSYIDFLPQVNRIMTGLVNKEILSNGVMDNVMSRMDPEVDEAIEENMLEDINDNGILDIEDYIASTDRFRDRKNMAFRINLLNEWLDKISINVSDIPYYMVGINMTILSDGNRRGAPWRAEAR